MQSVSVSLPFLLLSFLLLILPYLLIQTNAQLCHPDDESALLSFKSGIASDPDGELSSWIPGTACCYWAGLMCFEFGQNLDRIKGLTITGRISGTISPSLSKLVFLESFALSYLPKITGPFPDFLFGLPKLTSIYIGFCNLSGPLPQKLGTLTNLQGLDLVGNKFSGPVPDIFASLINLLHLSLCSNRFSGRIPNSITKLTNLTYLQLFNNRLTGTIPDGLRNLNKLYGLNLQQNLLSGTIPDFFTSFPVLLDLSISYNKLHGPIPPTISSLSPTLRSLGLAHNNLNGTIPSYLGNFSNLISIDLSFNHFTGIVPRSFSNLTLLQILDLSHNSLVDEFPTMNTTQIQTVDLSYNSFHLGKIPKWVTDQSTWGRYIKLSKCGIEMNLEDWKPKDPLSYYYVDLSDNEISGSPVILLNQTDYLVSFKASGNQMKFDMGSLKIPKMMMELDLSRNIIFGKVPKKVAGIKRLNVSYNDHLCGFPQPPCI